MVAAREIKCNANMLDRANDTLTTQAKVRDEKVIWKTDVIR